MARILTLPHLSLPSLHPLLSPSLKPRKLTIASAISAPETTTTRNKNKKKQSKEESAALAATSKEEKALRFVFMEELMKRARDKDVEGVSDVIYDMVAAGLRPGPRSYHGLVVANVMKRDCDGAMQALRRELSTGLHPLHETFVAMIRLFGSEGHSTRAMEILSAMEKLNYDIRQAWLVLVEELVRSNNLEDANKVFLKGTQGGLRATDQLYDKMIEEDCKVGDHANALTIAYEMEAAGKMATTFHFNCLLSVQATCGIPEVAMATFENMEYCAEDYMKPDTETYNWVIQAYTRAESYDRILNVGELLGLMLEAHKRVQPNMRTYALLVECFTKYCVIKEAVRHFRALKNFEGGTRFLHHDGQFKDPLSLYLRALCREGRIVELLEALEAMSKDNQPIPPRAMILSKKYRTLVSSWIEPLQEEAELGYEIDYYARYVAEGGLTGDRKRWVPRGGKTPLDPDALGFVYSYPLETSFKQHCLDEWRRHHKKLFRHLRRFGPSALGNVTEADYIKVEERLLKILRGPGKKAKKPKAASKMIVPELRQELEAQGLPTDGNRNVLYQRVQKARRINLSRGRPLWIPPVGKVEDEVDEEVEELISRIALQDGNTEFWKRRFLGEVFPNELKKFHPVEQAEEGDEANKAVEKKEAEQTGSTELKDKGAEDSKTPLQMIGVQSSKDPDPDMVPRRSKKNKRKWVYPDLDEDEDWFPVDAYEAMKEMRERKVFDVDDMYTIADAWGWTWDLELRNRTPRKWSPEWEVELAIKVMLKVIELGGTPTVGDCAMILRAAIQGPVPSSFETILQTAHKLGYKFGSPLYDEVITLCLNLKELDVAIAIVADLETGGIMVSDETLDKVISARSETDS